MKKIKPENSQISDLKKQIEDFQKKHKRKWHQPSNIVSGVAVIISIITIVYSHFDITRQTNVSKVDNLTRSLSEIINNNISFVENDSGLDPSEKLREIRVDREKINALNIDNADAIVGEIPDQVTAAEYAVLGEAKMDEIDIKEAEKYFKNAASSPKALDSDKFAAYSRLAEIYMSYGEKKLADDNFIKAVKSLENEPPENHRNFMVGTLYLNWALSNLQLNAIQDAIDNLDFSTKYLLKLPNDLPEKYYNLRQVYALLNKIDITSQGVDGKKVNELKALISSQFPKKQMTTSSNRNNPRNSVYR